MGLNYMIDKIDKHLVRSTKDSNKQLLKAIIYLHSKSIAPEI